MLESLNITCTASGVGREKSDSGFSVTIGSEWSGHAVEEASRALKVDASNAPAVKLRRGKDYYLKEGNEDNETTQRR